MKLLTDRIKLSETRQFRCIFPNTLNLNDMLFGGTAMQWMDEVAFITASRYTRKKMVTTSVSEIKFHKVIHSGSMIEIIGKVTHAGKVKLTILIEVYTEEIYSNAREKAAEATFTFVAVNNVNKPLPLN